MATRMMADTPVNYETTQYYLGHSLRKKTRPISELAMGKLVGELDGHIDQIMRDDGWKVLKGYRYRRVEFVEAKAHRTISSCFFPNESPGFVQRAENQKHLVIRIERLTAEIRSYLNQATKQGGESDEVMFKRDFEYERELKQKIKSLNFPYHPKWSELKTYIREEFDDYNPLPDVLKLQNLSSGVSCLSSRTLKNSRLSQACISSWVKWANKCLLSYLNPKGHRLRAVRVRSALILNSALFGGAHRPAILHALAGHKLDSLLYDFEYFQTDNVSHVEIYVTDTYEEDGERFEDRSWLDRWIPDPLSCILLSQPDQLLDKSDVLTEVKSLLSKSGVDVSHKAVLKKLAKCSNGINLECREFFRDSIGTGRFASRPQSLNSWARHLTGGSLLAKRVEEAVVLESIETANPFEKPLVESSGGLKQELEVLKKNFRVIGKNETEIVGATRLQCCQYIEAKLDELQASFRYHGLPRLQ